MGYAGYGNHAEDTKKSEEPERSGVDKPKDGKAPPADMHPAGPHADPKLTNPDATPGTGVLPDGRQGGDADSASG